ncbi:uncharacterized protein LOC116294337 [Actinia tenebrosa]|uniref:Uncharacterized protein LOC116294337 n=1 Tax=Actinia tenebrosa TaxID=6105 RepID=A0A6P8HYU0_ACTTE|nr:uncharacterized protein LOC116294337 [Actinia tenebrosa]
MASAARVARSLLRNTSTLNISSKAILRCLNSSAPCSTKSLVSLRSCLKETGLLNATRNSSLSSRVNFSKNFRVASALCNLAAMPLLAVESTGAGSDALDGSGSDDDGETWSQNSEEGYIGDDT